MGGMIRQVYQVVAMFAVLNLFGWTGLTGFLASSGKLTPERARQIVRVMRGEMDVSPVDPAAAPAGDQAETSSSAEGDHAAAESKGGETAPLETAVDRSREARIDREIVLRERNRFEAEIQQRLALSNSIMLQITSKLDGLHTEMDAFEKKRIVESGFKDAEGFKKELEVFKTLKPAQAFEYLGRKDVTEAARLLIEMDPRTVAKILESAKSGEQKQKADQILQQIRAVAPNQAAQVAGTP